MNEIISILNAVKFNFSNEQELQDGIAQALAHAGVMFNREYRLSDHDRIDFYIPDYEVGIEVKTKTHGSPSATSSQCLRYCQHEKIKGLILATSRLRLDLPETLNGKPVCVLQIWSNAF